MGGEVYAKWLRYGNDLWGGGSALKGYEFWQRISLFIFPGSVLLLGVQSTSVGYDFLGVGVSAFLASMWLRYFRGGGVYTFFGYVVFGQPLGLSAPFKLCAFNK